MQIQGMRNLIADYDENISKLEEHGIKVKELSGFSDREYYFIGAENPYGKSHGSDWLFTADTVHEFNRLAKLTLRLLEAK